MRRTDTRKFATTTTLVVVLVAALALPTAALAVGDVPDEMVDPVGAMEPEINVGEPAEEASAQGAAPAAQIPEVDAADADAPTAGTTAAPAQPTSVGSGSLPFTGPEPGLLMLVFLVGSVALLGGVTAIGYGRALAESS